MVESISELTNTGATHVAPASDETDEYIFQPEDHTMTNLPPEVEILGALFHSALSGWFAGKIEDGVDQFTPLSVDFENIMSATG